jgi:hypothetical protein
MLSLRFCIAVTDVSDGTRQLHASILLHILLDPIFTKKLKPEKGD